MDAMPTAALLQIDGLRHVYPMGDAPDRLILDDVAFTLKTHEIVALLGRSGCGKSTLLRIIAGLMAPSAGGVRIDGHPVDGPSSDVAMVFQSFALFPWLTVPALGAIRPAMIRNSVDFPQPERPSRATISWDLSEKATSSRITRSGASPMG